MNALNSKNIKKNDNQSLSKEQRIKLRNLKDEFNKLDKYQQIKSIEDYIITAYNILMEVL